MLACVRRIRIRILLLSAHRQGQQCTHCDSYTPFPHVFLHKIYFRKAYDSFCGPMLRPTTAAVHQIACYMFLTLWAVTQHRRSLFTSSETGHSVQKDIPQVHHSASISSLPRRPQGLLGSGRFSKAMECSASLLRYTGDSLCLLSRRSISAGLVIRGPLLLHSCVSNPLRLWWTRGLPRHCQNCGRNWASMACA